MADDQSLSSTARIQRCLDRLRAGDENARAELIQVSFRRLFQLTRKLARPFPNVKRVEDTEGIFSLAYERLWTSLHEIVPQTVRQFFALAAKQVRWTLLDLARRARREKDEATVSFDELGLRATAGGGLESREGEPERFLAWVELHTQVDQLPDDLAEVFSLKYYFDLPHAEAAEVMGVSTKTLGRLWRDARVELHRRLHGLWPDF
jgi:RNA polymerase sigma-70 factor (ECF subfamily)